MDKDQNQIPAKTLVWDCSSSLYDSFELKSFKRQLDSAIVSRCLSMPHLSEHPPPPLPPARKTKKHSKFSKSLHKLLRSVFRLRPTFRVPLQTYQHDEHGYHIGVHWRSGSLASIPEVPEKDFGSPEIDSAVSRTMSERFTSTTAGQLKVVS